MEIVHMASVLAVIVFWKTHCVTPAFANVAVKNFRISTQDAEEITLVQSACACKTRCLTLDCTTYSVTRSGDDVRECRMSVPPVRRYTWEENSDSYIVHKSDYVMQGQHFYKMKGNSSFYPTNATCFSDGGQVPVLLNLDTEYEFREIMAYYGIQKTWVGAYRKIIYDSEENIIGSEPAVWMLANGSSIAAPDMPEHANRQCFILDTELPETYDNTVYCSHAYPFVCQRDY